jgi:hypothetical protein
MGDIFAERRNLIEVGIGRAGAKGKSANLSGGEGGVVLDEELVRGEKGLGSGSREGNGFFLGEEKFLGVGEEERRREKENGEKKKCKFF